ISLAIHSASGHAYDWLDGALFLRVTSLYHFEGVANLNASVTARRRANGSDSIDRQGDTSREVMRA
ncbi:MAG TPA: hypothetical protein VFB70_09630, partial [Pyrinomonadaceae bacterium]|nr:hypothetical protein [Pyrinomonadaceae bacterium]